MSGPQMTVLHLSTGNVLAAVAAGALTPTVDDLTGGEVLVVRLPTGATIAVTPQLLTAVAVARDDDVLTRPTAFRVDQGVPPVTAIGPMALLSSVSRLGDQGAECLSLWQAGDQLEVVRETLDSTGKPTAAKPPGATHRIAACKGSPLTYGT